MISSFEFLFARMIGNEMMVFNFLEKKTFELKLFVPCYALLEQLTER